MAESTQSYATHRRYYPLFHFVAIPLLALNLILRVVFVWRHPLNKMAWWDVVFAVALVALALAARIMALAVQDRLIRLEETLRLQRVLPDDLRGQIAQMSTGQFVSLRFCADDELPDLARVVLKDGIRDRNEIKQKIKNWRADTNPRA